MPKVPKPLPPPWDRFVPFLQKMSVWALFFVILWFLRPFFFLVFLTFVFGYVLEHLVEKMEGKISSRSTRVVLGFLGILAVLIGLGFAIAPDLARQAAAFPEEIQRHIGTLDRELDGLRSEYDVARALFPEDTSAGEIVGELLHFDTAGKSAAADTAAPLDEPEVVPAGNSPELWRPILPLILSVVSRTAAVGSAFLLALLFSFLVVLDYPNLARGARALRDTRLRFVYEEVSDNIFHFFRTLGRALEAQLMIAIVNTGLTAVGLAFMGLENLAFLSAVVFVCSFIPVVGVFISSVPICLAAITNSGFGLALIAILFIIVVHMVEAYFLNPKIYGAHLRMNPVLVLAILVISHHLFGVWGLVLGVPVANYLYFYVVKGRERLTRSGRAEPLEES